MSEKTSIEWTDSSWNPVRARDLKTGRVGWHCEKVSPGCAHCYAETLNRNGRGKLGTKRNYTRVERDGVELFLDEKTLVEPLRWRKPRRVFVCSMTDLFGEWVPVGWIDRIYAVMMLAPRHTFQILTKRPMFMRQYVAEPGRLSEIAATASVESFDEMTVSTRSGRLLPNTELVDSEDEDDPLVRVDVPKWPLRNVWNGVSIESQEQVPRIEDLAETPSALRFISAEPLLGPLDFSKAFLRRSGIYPISWVIVGGESGPGARPCDVAWVRSIVQQCREACVSVFVKQFGRWVSGAWNGFGGVDRYLLDDGRVFVPGARSSIPTNAVAFHLFDPKGGDPYHWPEDLRVREFPE